MGCTFTGAQRGHDQAEGNEDVSAYAQQLYDCRVRYIGAASDDAALIEAMDISENLGGYTLELETDNEPYVLRLIFTGQIKDADMLNRDMQADAILLLALIDNASEIQWRYSSDPAADGEGIFTGSMTIEEANAVLNENDIKDFGQSAAKVQELLDWLDTDQGLASAETEGSVDNEPEEVTASIDRTNLEACVSEAILNANAGLHMDSDFAAEAHTILMIEEPVGRDTQYERNGNGSFIRKFSDGDNETTVYAMALYLEFSFTEDGFSETGGSHVPVAITFEINDAGEYGLKEYWEPQDGGGYAPSIKEKFPADIYEDALDTQKYVVAHIQSCYAQAVECGNVDVAAQIAGLIEMITSSPAQMSDPQAYIDEHVMEYRQLIYFGEHTLKYCFAAFEQGGQTGLEGHIMAMVCRDILGDAGDIDASTGQEWYGALPQSLKDQYR